MLLSRILVEGAVGRHCPDLIAYAFVEVRQLRCRAATAEHRQNRPSPEFERWTIRAMMAGVRSGMLDACENRVDVRLR